MGINGKPTTIDFAKNYVIAFILSETNLDTIVNPYFLVVFPSNNANRNSIDYKLLELKKETALLKNNAASKIKLQFISQTIH